MRCPETLHFSSNATDDLQRKGREAMQDSKKKCGQWGLFFDGDSVIYHDMRWRIVSALKKDVPHGCAPIKPEDEEAEGITGVIMVPIDDLSRV